MNKTNLTVCTPSFDGKLSFAHTQSLLELASDQRVVTTLKYIFGDSLITRARNILINQYYKENQTEKQDYLLWLDSDVYVSANGILEAISLKKDVVAFPVPLKQDMTPFGIPHSIVGPYEKIDDYLYKIQYAATGALMLSTKAVNAVVEHFIKKEDWFWLNLEKNYDVFKTGSGKDNIYMSEDWYLCSKLRELGFDIFAYTNTGVMHFESPRMSWNRGPSKISLNQIKDDYSFYPEKPQEFIVGCDVYEKMI